MDRALVALLTVFLLGCTQDEKMVRIPAGEFIMGSKESEGNADEHPQHRVYLDEYHVSKYELTNKEYKDFVDKTGYTTEIEQSGWGWVWIGSKWKKVEGANWRSPEGPGTTISDRMDHPVVQVSWIDALAYCNWLSNTTGENYRLPTEAQWEKAARGTDGKRWPWGDEWDGLRLNFADRNTDCRWSEKSTDDGYKYTAPVGSYPRGASPYGVMDMAGNVWELCWDWYDRSYYRASPESNPYGPDSGGARVLRGGSWYADNNGSRCALRYQTNPSYGDAGNGFRIVRIP